jgi:hypothetical protein
MLSASPNQHNPDVFIVSVLGHNPALKGRSGVDPHTKDEIQILHQSANYFPFIFL